MRNSNSFDYIDKNITFPFVISEAAIHKCKSCLKSYRYKSSLINHAKYECGKEPQFPCLLCPYKAHRKGNHQRHMVMRHNIHLK